MVHPLLTFKPYYLIKQLTYLLTSKVEKSLQSLCQGIQSSKIQSNISLLNFFLVSSSVRDQSHVEWTQLMNASYNKQWLRGCETFKSSHRRQNVDDTLVNKMLSAHLHPYLYQNLRQLAFRKSSPCLGSDWSWGRDESDLLVTKSRIRWSVGCITSF